MKFTLSSFNPFAWFSQPPMTEAQIRLYDLNQEIEDIDYKLFENTLEKIYLEHTRRGLREQQEYIQHREPKEQTGINEIIDEQIQKSVRLFAFGSNH